MLVRETGKGYELIAGERRWRAARLAGLKTIPAMVQKIGGARSLELALIENIQRLQLNPIEEARAFASLIADFHLTQEAVAERVGRRRATVANSLRLLKLPRKVQEMIREGVLTAGHAKALLALGSNEGRILEAAKAMAEGSVSVRGAERMTRPRKAAGQAVEAAVNPNVHDAELRLQRVLGTMVRIRTTQPGKGRIEIDYYSEEDLQRLFELLEGSGDWQGLV